MASIKDAFEESIQEENATLKYIIFAIPIYYWVDLYVKNEDMSKFWILALILIPLYIGFLTQCTTNVRNGKNKVLPSFNIFSMF